MILVSRNAKYMKIFAGVSREGLQLSDDSIRRQDIVT